MLQLLQALALGKVRIEPFFGVLRQCARNLGGGLGLAALARRDRLGVVSSGAVLGHLPQGGRIDCTGTFLPVLFGDSPIAYGLSPLGLTQFSRLDLAGARNQRVGLRSDRKSVV